MSTAPSIFLLGLLAASLLSSVFAQSSTTQSVSLVLTTSSLTITTATRSQDQNIPLTTIVPTTFNVTVTPTQSSSAASSATHTPVPITLATKLDPAFGVLGALLILTGVPSAFWGHKNRWTSFFLIGFYTLSLVCLVLILKFGVLPAVNPPSKTLRGMFVLSCAVAGVAGGAIAIFFWKGAKYFIGAWGGFAFALWIQCFHNGGLISPIGLRWILYIGSAVVGFVLCTIPKIHYHILLVSTAFVGASAFILGVDCFTTAGLKEFYVWNIGFRSFFPKFANNGIAFPVSQTMQIELGLTGAVALMGIAVQLRILKILQRKLAEIAEEQKKRDEEAELDASERFAGVVSEREQWEKEHPTHGRKESSLSTTPLMKDHEFSSPTTDSYRNSALSLGNGQPRPVSDYIGATLQSPGVLPALDLGIGIQDNVPKGFIAEDKGQKKGDLEGDQKREELMAEILTIRRSIDALKSETSSHSGSDSRHPSLTSKHTLSLGASSFLPAAHLRPQKHSDSRVRVHSMELSALTNSSLGASIGRPTSAPLRDNDWDSYLHDRKLLQPPAGVTHPIPTTPINPRITIPPAVAEALSQRKKRESALKYGDAVPSGSSSPTPLSSSSDDIPVAAIAKMHHKKHSSSSNAAISILPPRKIASPTPHRPSAPRTKTFEELAERHREKMKDLQAPLSQSQKEQADLLAAKQRWERSKAAEKDAVNRRLAEKAAAYTKEAEKRGRADEGAGKAGRNSLTLRDAARPRHQHSRSLSADKLATLPGPGASSKRVSTMKVEDWQKYQQDARTERPPSKSFSKRGSRLLNSESIPFPNDDRSRPNHDKQNRPSGGSRDPPS